MLRILLLILIIGSHINMAIASYSYELIEKDNHRIHVVTINPSAFDISFVSAHDQVFGRATVGEIAARRQGDIAINAGFFEIGGNDDGRPSGTLIIDGMIYGLMKPQHACLIKRNGQLSIEMIKPELTVEIGKWQISPSRFNRFIDTKGSYLYTSSWGPSSLSPYKNRKEIIIDSNYKVLSIASHGDNKIPEGGYLLSLPFDSDISGVTVGDTAKFNWHPEYLTERDTSVVLGTPALILNGRIQNELSDKDIHARTAVGIKENGDLVIVIAEHVYSQSLKAVTLDEVNKIIKAKQISIDDLTVRKLQQIVVDSLVTDNTTIGLTLEQLAKFMFEMGCVSAINLDGGGSSTLYIDGKYVNHITGDQDEGLGKKVERPVSNAIIFIKRDKNG